MSAKAAIFLAATVALGLTIERVMRTAGDKVGGYVADHELEGAAAHIRQADTNLTEMVKRELGVTQELDREIDFLNPTEEDMRFLVDLLRAGAEPQRRSAARALVEIGDPRTIRPLLRASTGASDPLFFCLAAQEILKHQTRSGASEWILDATLDPTMTMDPACAADLKLKLDQIGASSPEILAELLFSERPQVQLHALRGLDPALAGVEAKRRALELIESTNPEVAAAARVFGEGRAAPPKAP